jgi:hypothetical protein
MVLNDVDGLPVHSVIRPAIKKLSLYSASLPALDHTSAGGATQFSPARKCWVGTQSNSAEDENQNEEAGKQQNEEQGEEQNEERYEDDNEAPAVNQITNYWATLKPTSNRSSVTKREPA